MVINKYVFYKKGKELILSDFEFSEYGVTKDDIEEEIEICGICGSDAGFSMFAQTGV